MWSCPWGSLFVRTRGWVMEGLPGLALLFPLGRHSALIPICVHSGQGRSGDTDDFSPSWPTNSQVRVDAAWGLGACRVEMAFLLDGVVVQMVVEWSSVLGGEVVC